MSSSGYSRIHVHVRVVANFQRDFIGRLPTRKDTGTGTVLRVLYTYNGIRCTQPPSAVLSSQSLKSRVHVHVLLLYIDLTLVRLRAFERMTISCTVSFYIMHVYVY